MISSFVWLILVQKGLIDAMNAPWEIYLPICIIEVIVYFMGLNKLDK